VRSKASGGYGRKQCLQALTAGRKDIKPIDDKVLSRTASSVPANWTTLRDKWWYLHIMVNIAELAALGILVWTVSKLATTK
jgi:hypothetical protein